MATVWDRTSAFLTDNLAGILPLALITIFLPSSVQQNLTAAAATAGPGLKAVLSLVTIALTVLSLWGKLAITAMAIERIVAPDTPAAVASRRLFPAIGVILLFGVIVMALSAPPVAILAAYGFDFTTLSNLSQAVMPEAAKIPFAIAVLVMLPLAIWLITRLVMVTPVVVAERRGAGALPRAFALSRGLFWRILGVLILYAIVSGVAELAAKAVFGTIFELVVGGEGPFSLAKILTSIVSGAVSCAFTVLVTVFCAKLYLATSGQDDLPLP